MPIFDSSNFVSDVGKSIGGLASSATGLASQGTSALNNALSSSGLSLDGIKNFATSKLDSLSSALPSFGKEFNRAATNLFSSRSEGSNASNDPNTAIPGSQESQKLSVDRFPPSGRREEYITIQFAKYTRPDNFNKGEFATVYSVHLPIPRQLSEQFSIDVAPQQLKTFGTMIPIAQNLAAEAMGTRTSSYKDYADEGIGALYSGLSQAGAGAIDKLTPFSGEQVVGTVQQFAGSIPNPHISVFFNGVDLRPSIEFSWLFTPKTPDESALLKGMLRKIKQKVLPAISSGGGNIMDYPHMVQIDIKGLDQDILPKYKKGLITSININYTPNGPSFFKGTNSPTFIAFSFLFQEIEIFTSNDFGGDAASAVERLEGLSNLDFSKFSSSGGADEAVRASSPK